MLSITDWTLDISTENFHSPWVQDLLWLLNPSHDLVVDLHPYRKLELNCTEHQWQELLHWLTQLDLMPQSPIPHNHRLGLYFEELIAYFFSHNPVFKYTLVARNHQIFGEVNGIKTTLGALDFLFELPAQQNQVLIHLETAVKFYLEYGHGTQMWLGPNSKDSLARKCGHMRAHQLPLAQKLPWSKPINSCYCLKGILFNRWRPNLLYSSRQSYWLPLTELPSLLETTKKAWWVLTKSQWLSGHDQTEELDLATITEELRSSSGVMLRSVNNQRLMVVNNGWPELSNPQLHALL